jgi:precorrin-6A/cobalt-precorrin-6A reductase
VTRRLLILGGTGEARALAALAAAHFGTRLEIVVSLAGRTRSPDAGPGTQRIGGFGGPDGLATYLTDAKIDLVVDATHPFATTISASARAAARRTGVRLLRLERPGWQPQAGDSWIEVSDARHAAKAAADLGKRIFLTFGGREVAAFANMKGRWFLVRRIEPPEQALPLAQYALVLGRGPFATEAEIALLRRHRIDVVVTKASGGPLTRAKLDAARALGLPVVMIARPAAGPEPAAASPEEALGRIAAMLFGDAGIDGAAALSA